MKSDPGKQKEWQRRGAEKYAQKRREQALASEGGGKAVAKRPARRRKPTGPTPEELAGRALVAARDKGVCIMCGKPGAGLNWHHRKLRSQGGDWSASNGISLHGSGTTLCHGWVHAHPRAATRLGLLVPSRRDPREYPVWSYSRWLLLADDGTAKVITEAEAQARIAGEPPDPVARPTQKEEP